MRRRCFALWLLLLLLPAWAWGQTVLRRHMGLVNPLDVGTSCSTATLSTAISTAPSGQGVLMLTPVDRAGSTCTWTITSNLTVPTNLVLAIPNGAVVSVNAGVTLTLMRYPREDNTDWRTGAGTITIIEAPPGGGGGGPGDITDVWTCNTANCNALTAAAGDTLDAGAATSSAPTTRSTVLPGTCTEGQHHQDTDSGGSETYVCTSAAPTTWVKLMGSTDVLSAAQVPLLNTIASGLTGNRCVETTVGGLLTVAGSTCAATGGDVSDVWNCTGANCNALVAAPGDTFDAGLADTSMPATRSTSLPGTCLEGQMHQDTDSGGSETYICTNPPTGWTKLATTVGAYAANFTSQTTLTILGSTHQLGTADLAIFIKDANTPRGVVIPNTITIDDSTFTVVVTFLQAQSGRIYIKHVYPIWLLFACLRLLLRGLSMVRLRLLLLVFLCVPLPARAFLINGNLTLTGAMNHCDSTTGTDSYACPIFPVPTTPAYQVNTLYSFTADVANTDGASLNLNGLGAKDMIKLHGGITYSLHTGDIRPGMRVMVVYDGTNFQCINCVGNDLVITRGLLSARPASCLETQYYDAIDGPAGCQLSRCNEQNDWETVGNCGGGQVIPGVSFDADAISGFKYNYLAVGGDYQLEVVRTICAITGTTGITLTLPSVANAPISEYLIVVCDNSTGTVTVEPDGADLINNVNQPFTMSGQGSQMDITLIAGKWQLVSTAPLSGAGSQGIVQLTPRSVGFPATNAAVLDNSQSFPRLLFDNLVSQCVWWTFIMPLDYVSTLAFQYVYAMDTVNSGSHFLDISVLAITDGTENVVSGSYGTANACNAANVPGTAGFTQTVTCSLTNTDTLGPGKLTRLRACRNIADTANEPSEVYGGLLTYAR